MFAEMYQEEYGIGAVYRPELDLLKTNFQFLELTLHPKNN